MRVRNDVAGSKGPISTRQKGRVRHGRPGSYENGAGLVSNLKKMSDLLASNLTSRKLLAEFFNKHKRAESKEKKVKAKIDICLTFSPLDSLI